MKKKRSITVDPEVLSSARRYAHRRGVRRSVRIEQSGGDAAGKVAPAFASRWRGRFTVAFRDDQRCDALIRKHL